MNNFLTIYLYSEKNRCDSNTGLPEHKCWFIIHIQRSARMWILTESIFIGQCKGKLCQHYTFFQDRLHNTHYYTLQESITYKCNKPLCPVVHPYQNIENMKILTLLQLTNIILETYRVINLGHPSPNPDFSVFCDPLFFLFSQCKHSLTFLRLTIHVDPTVGYALAHLWRCFTISSRCVPHPLTFFLNLRLLIKPQAVNLGGTDQWFPLL